MNIFIFSVDLYFFYTHAQQLGGYDKITSNKLWKKLYDAMGGDPGSTSAATCTRRHYERLLLPFERHLNGEKDTKKKGRKAKDTTAKKGKKNLKNNDNSGATNGLKYKKKNGKQVVNGLKSKNKCNEDNECDDNSSTTEKSIETQQPEGDGEPKRPKLIVKFDLLKVKSSSHELDNESNDSPDDENDDKNCVKQELVNEIKDKKILDKLEVQKIYDFNSDTEDTDDDKKKLFESKREDITEEEDNTEMSSIEENKKPIVEIKVESKLVVDTESEDPKTSANSDSVIHLSPVSDICEEEETNSDNKTELSAISLTKTGTQPTLAPNATKEFTVMDIKPDKALLTPNPLINLSVGQSSVGGPPPLPFPVAASPLFSISTLVNSVPSVKVESMASPPPLPLSLSTASIPPTQPNFVSSVPMRATAPKPLSVSPPLHMKKSSYDSYARRPTVIKTTNPMLSTQYQPKPVLNYKSKPSTGVPSVLIPAHSVSTSLKRSEITKSKSPAEVVCNDVLDLSVKKRCLEADSRTSPSQTLIDGPNGLDLSVKKRKVDSPKQEVPKLKLDHRINHSMTSPSMRSVTPLAPPPTPPHKLCPPPQSPVNCVVSQSVSKPSSVQQSVHYKKESHSQSHIQNHNKSVTQLELQKYVNEKHKLLQINDKQQSHYQSHHKSSPRPTPSPHHHSPHHQSPQRQSQSVPQQVSHQTKQSQSYHQKEQQIDRHVDRHHVSKHSQQNQLLVKPQVIHPVVSMATQSATHQSIHNSVNERYNQRDSNQSHRQQSAHHNSHKHSLQSPAYQSRQQHSPNHRNDRIDDRMSSKLLSPAVVSLPSMSSLSTSSLTNAPTHRTTVPAISEYNPSLPTFNPGLYAAPNLWWPGSGPAFNPSGVSSSSPYLSAATAAAMGPISPHLMASHPLLSGAYGPTAADHLLAQLNNSAKVADFAAYKQLLDQHHSQQTHPYQLFQHLNSFYATK